MDKGAIDTALNPPYNSLLQSRPHFIGYSRKMVVSPSLNNKTECTSKKIDWNGGTK